MAIDDNTNVLMDVTIDRTNRDDSGVMHRKNNSTKDISGLRYSLIKRKG